MDVRQRTARGGNSNNDDSDEDVDEECYDVLTWEELAVKEQQQYYTMFGDRHYNAFKPNEKLYLMRQVGFPLFGPPQSQATLANKYTGYDSTQLKALEAMVKTIEDNQSSKDETLLATVFVSLKIDDMPMISVPVFRVPKMQGSEVSDDVVFIDVNCRVYKGWKKYLKENTLPGCRCCYPSKGVYEGDVNGRVKIKFGVTPAAKIIGRVLSNVDTVSNVVALTAAGVTMVSLAVPVAAGAVVAATVGGITAGLYGIGRSIGVLSDRYRHKQNISLSDPEARSNWLSVAGGVLGIGSGAAMQAVSSLAREGVVIGAVGRAAVTTLNIVSLAANGTCLINNLVYLIERTSSGELTKLEVFQFSVSFFFFTHSLVNFQTASKIIRQSQRGVISDFTKSLKNHRHRRAFRRLVRDTTRGMDRMEGKAKIIRGIKHITHKDAFFSSLARGREEFAKNRAKLTLTENGKIRINDKVDMHPAKFSAMSGDHRKFILQSTKSWSKGHISSRVFRHEIKPILRQNLIHYSRIRARTREGFNTAFGASSMKNIVIAGKGIFNDIKKNDIRLLKSLHICFESNDMLKLFKTLVERVKCTDAKEFLDIIEFLHTKTAETLTEMEVAYHSARSEAETDDENFNREQFDNIYGIVGDRKQHFQNVIISTLKQSHNMRNLAQEYTQRTAGPSDNVTRRDKFVLAGIHFMFRDFSENGDMSDNEIFSTVSEVLGTPVTADNCELVREGNMISACCFGENTPTRTVIIEVNKEEGVVTTKEV